MCLCGHVRGVHSGDEENCDMCSCDCFIDREFHQRLGDLLRRVNEQDAKLDAIGARLDVLQDRILEAMKP